MKVVCDGCSTKYSIGDDKLIGKVFKIRCKKCSRVMVVRGAEPAPAEPAPVEAPEAAWYFVVDGHQLGPHDGGELARRRAAGELDDDTYVWREGFTDWQTYGSVAELRPTDAPRLRGERNETSVLFTLGSLARLASPPAPAEPPPARADVEGSGLIDIRSLAKSLAPAAAAAPRAAPDPLDDLPVLRDAAFGSPDVLIPRPRGSDRRLVVALAAAAGAFAIAAAVMLVLVLRGGTPEAAPPPTTTRVASVEPPAPREASDVPAVPAPAPAPAAQPEPPPPPPPSPPPPPPARPAPTSRPPRPPAVRPAPPAPAQPAAPAASECNEITCAFDGNTGPCCRLPDTLDRAAVGTGIATIDVRHCGRGDLKLSMQVSPAGTVTSTSVVGTADPALAACVSAAARRGTFAKTKRGRSFAYTWRL